ncbi:hypothetical protein [Pedobacter nyackensis]|uniref:hypothetical protein n=1 Tax=Pedobacter nyackensis TaxID=475255 RepID=UPI00292F84BF|nr:hypothetical protein [Pedobacter nyackensis]
MKYVLLGLLTFYSFIGNSQNRSIKVKIHSIKGYNQFEPFAAKAASLLDSVLNSEEFKTEILDGKFTKKNGLSNEQVYNSIIQSHELQGAGGEDGIVDLRLRTINKDEDHEVWLKRCELNSSAGTIGIDGLGDGIFAICPQRLELWAMSDDTAALAAHFAHEYMHLLGYSHNGLFKSRTLVYKVGDIVEAILNSKEKPFKTK